MSVFRNNLKTESIRSLYSSLINGNKYLFLGKTTGWTTTPDDVLDTINEDISVKSNILSGYKLTNTDIKYVISRNSWSNNTIYKEHSSNKNLNNSEYSISVIQSQNLYIWICISNNNNAKSTATPNAVGVGIGAKVSTTDGYIWQLVYQILSYESDSFVTDFYIPLVDSYNSFDAVTSLTKIDIIGTKIFDYSINPGNVNVNFKVLSDNTNNDTVYLDQPLNQHINATPNYYKNWLLILKSSPTPTTVHVIKILSSSYTSNILSIQTCEDLPANISGYSYSIVPGLKVNGDGTSLKIYPILDTDKKIIDIEIINYGINYRSLTINVENAEGIVTDYTVTPRFNISGNMSYSILNTLKCSELMIYRKITASGLNAFSDKLRPETGTLSSLGYDTNDIRQFGIISSETANPVVIGTLPVSFRGYDVITATKSTTSTLNITIDDYICTVDALGNLSAYGQIVSIAENPADATKVVFAVIPLYGTFSTTYTQLLNLNTTTSTTTVLTPNTGITAVNPSQYTRLNGRILYLENILPSQITTNTSLNIRVLLSL